jgi:hypothetical protein
MDNKTTKKLTGLVILLLLVMACSSTATAQPTVTSTLVIPTATANPNVLTCEQITAVGDEFRATLTQAQWYLPNEYDSYIETIKGKPIEFSGNIVEVYFLSEVNIIVENELCSANLLRVPKEVAVTLKKGQPVSVRGTVSNEFEKEIIVQIDVTELNH